ncbi:2-oxo acid dehydrogenase subunit E2 [Microbacterium thalassium]|uniref:Dihydrolipoamide acetyltransferase component of pyruvate dehydrogenase complex n=1 Tax=Microbacterium thalassium TaxID=362649 RepID=A0A7X0FLJ3_9MICO|nr:2-oxo acid dehydrogenase subunit E2 [Microbacterium thalassium]MBB6389706.1 pyruvate dehydrogenase E2 component (dihydrolipoamide acetyltransferase) [Microbacterium thalassium]GLK24757.1 dihydrolipoamide acetyltransferase component of pyruvate dehydrogenase complex [Microbacterium thalassium]
MGDFRMPSLGADMTEGKVVEWLVKPGDHVDRGDIIAEVDTAKTVMEVETFEGGTIAEFLVDLGETVPVGTPIARITAAADGEPAEPAEAVVTEAPAPASETHEPVAHATPPVRHLAHELGVDLDHLHGSGRGGAITRADVEAAAFEDHAVAAPPVPATATTSAPGADRVRSSPAARRLAADLGVDLAAVHGTGPANAVTLADVRAAAPASAPSPRGPEPAVKPAAPPAAAEQDDRVEKLHRAVGALMARSKREIPHYYLSTTIDLGAAQDWMRRTNAGRPITKRLVMSALLLAATAQAAKRAPRVNGFYTDDGFESRDAVHLGVAMALRGGGLVAPAILDADTLSVDDLMAGLRDLAKRAEKGRLRRAEMADGTITVTNLGDLGVESILGVIFPPQVALVGFGRVVERPVAHDGLLGVHPTVTATLSADHRASDGMEGGRFLALIDELLQKPEEL